MLNYHNIDFSFIGTLEETVRDCPWKNLIDSVLLHQDDSVGIYNYCAKFPGVFPTKIVVAGEEGFDLQFMFLSEQCFRDFCNDNFSEPEDKWPVGIFSAPNFHSSVNLKMILTEEGYRLIDDSTWPKYMSFFDYNDEEELELDKHIHDKEDLRKFLESRGCSLVKYNEETKDFGPTFFVEIFNSVSLKRFCDSVNLDVTPESEENIQSLKHIAPIWFGGTWMLGRPEQEYIDMAEDALK